MDRYAAMAAGIAWTRGVLDQAGLLDVPEGLPLRLRLRLPGGDADSIQTTPAWGGAPSGYAEALRHWLAFRRPCTLRGPRVTLFDVPVVLCLAAGQATARELALGGSH